MIASARHFRATRWRGVSGRRGDAGTASPATTSKAGVVAAERARCGPAVPGTPCGPCPPQGASGGDPIFWYPALRCVGAWRSVSWDSCSRGSRVRAGLRPTHRPRARLRRLPLWPPRHPPPPRRLRPPRAAGSVPGHWTPPAPPVPSGTRPKSTRRSIGSPSGVPTSSTPHRAADPASGACCGPRLSPGSRRRAAGAALLRGDGRGRDRRGAEHQRVQRELRHPPLDRPRPARQPRLPGDVSPAELPGRPEGRHRLRARPFFGITSERHHAAPQQGKRPAPSAAAER